MKYFEKFEHDLQITDPFYSEKSSVDISKISYFVIYRRNLRNDDRIVILVCTVSLTL